ncbi:MAG: glutamine synthetase III [Bacteroidales bacterium]|nr:glutamine synthetase III [Bacteroidales bacterium]
MATLRFQALQEVLRREPVLVESPSSKISDYFGTSVFTNVQMQKYLSNMAFISVQKAIDKGSRIDRKMADEVATGMKTWAAERGATHYTHWFHPLTDATAEKHDAFIEVAEDGSVIENFSGNNLTQQEPDASSFPSGGIRNTFEARGYTAWDPTSPAFIVGNTLCIPTIFVSYTGEALDYKMPLLKSLQVLDKAATEVCMFFDRRVTRVITTLGWEQEYFLVDDALYNARPDLVLTERTLMGHASARDQQLEDHYFSSISERVTAFMRNFEIEAYKLGIPLKTRHNEVAPNQFECAPIFKDANLAVDQNLLVMDIMKRIARKHYFRVIFHEKPFQGINGSGKHSNWSLLTDTGINLLAPGKTPRSNLMFLTFLVNTIRAVYEHADLLRASIASAGNAHRLGANEAPPAIISVFLGAKVTEMLDLIESNVTDKKMTPGEKTELKLNIGKIPRILLDNTDRNRTSPFAFTGNRFEFRAVGSSANCASPLIPLNVAVAEQLKRFTKDVDALMNKNVKKDEAIFQVLRKYIIECKPVRFEGNNYSDEWMKEAAARGLSNINDVPEAMDAYLSDSTVKLFARSGVLNLSELKGRTEVKLEMYTKKIQIEARVLGDLAINHIIPTAITYQSKLAENVSALKELFDDKEYKEMVSARIERIRELSENISSIKQKVHEMIEERKKANMVEDTREKADLYSKKVYPYLDQIRYHIDKLELMVDNELWPLPKFRELLFTR